MAGNAQRVKRAVEGVNFKLKEVGYAGLMVV